MACARCARTASGWGRKASRPSKKSGGWPETRFTRPMPPHKSTRLDGSGKSSTGIVEAESMKAARSHLRGLQLVPLGLTPVAVTEAGGAKRNFFTPRTFSSSGLAVWTRQLAGLVGAGLPLERALTALADEAEEQRQRDPVAHLRSEVNGGAPLARAPARVPPA